MDTLNLCPSCKQTNSVYIDGIMNPVFEAHFDLEGKAHSYAQKNPMWTPIQPIAIKCSNCHEARNDLWFNETTKEVKQKTEAEMADKVMFGIPLSTFVKTAANAKLRDYGYSINLSDSLTSLALVYGFDVSRCVLVNSPTEGSYYLGVDDLERIWVVPSKE